MSLHPGRREMRTLNVMIWEMMRYSWLVAAIAFFASIIGDVEPIRAQDRMGMGVEQPCNPFEEACLTDVDNQPPVFDPESGNDLIIEPLLDQNVIYANQPDNVYAIEPAAGAEQLEIQQDPERIDAPEVNVIDENMSVVENCLAWSGSDQEIYCGQQVTCDRFENGTCYFNSYRCIAFTDGKCYVVNTN